MAETPTFRLLDICNRHIQAIGMSSMHRSDIKLNTAVKTMANGQLMQCPGTEGFQALSIGVHWKTEIRNDAMKKATLHPRKDSTR